MEEAMRRRKIARGHLTRITRGMEEALNNPDTTLDDLEDFIEEFNTKLLIAEAYQDEDLNHHDPDGEDFETALTVVRTYILPRRTIRRKVINRIAALKGVSTPAISTSNEFQGFDPSEAPNSGLGLTAKGTKVPKLTLPRFSGKITEWNCFKESFSLHIDEKDFTDAEKMAYLVSLLDGEAKRDIAGFAVTGASYHTAWQVLADRYGDPEAIIVRHAMALVQLEGPKLGKNVSSTQQLSTLLQNINVHVRSLDNMGVPIKDLGTLLCPLIVDKFPTEIAIVWSRECEGSLRDLDHTTKFLGTEIKRIERVSDWKHMLQPSKGESKTSEKDSGSAVALTSVSEPNGGSAPPSGKRCDICKKSGHISRTCRKFLKGNVHEKRTMLGNARLCFKCLGNHYSTTCSRTCHYCQGPHHGLICNRQVPPTNLPPVTQSWQAQSYAAPPRPPPPGFSPINPVQAPANRQPNMGAHSNHACASVSMSNYVTLLPTATVRLQTSDDHIVDVVVMFDTGSDRTYIKSDVVQSCHPIRIGQEFISYSSFGGESSSKRTLRSVYEVNLLGRDGRSYAVEALEVPEICQPISKSKIPDKVLDEISHLPLANDYTCNSQQQVKILVGADQFWTLVDYTNAMKVGNLVAQSSKFGFLLSGSFEGHSDQDRVHTQLVCIQGTVPITNTLEEVTQFWDLDTIGITGAKESTQGLLDCDPVLVKFYDQLQYSPEIPAYQARLPYLSDSHANLLINNVKIATRRLESLYEGKLSKDPALRQSYEQVFMDYLKEGIAIQIPAEEIDYKGPVYYLPHRPVVKLDSNSTKVRPVFDASAKGYNKMSLNDCVHIGPNLLPDLVEVLIRFRRYPIALMGDVKQAFPQIYMHLKDQDLHRFLIMLYGETIHCRFTRVPFGNASSPFILNAVLRYHLSLFQDSIMKKELQDNIYVDNLLSGADSEKEALEKYEEACKMLSSAGMLLNKWTSNNRSVKVRFELGQVLSEEHKVLGIRWDSYDDALGFEGVYSKITKFASTKRGLLSSVGRIFDPLGLISPFTLQAKMLFQQCWRLGLQWDEELPADLSCEYQNWLKSSQDLSELRFPRAYFPNQPWRTSEKEVQLHAFGDASTTAYGTCIYIRVKSTGKFQCSLVAARTRVAPIKLISLPRLELLSSLITARLCEYVRTALSISSDQVFCYTDSMVSLGWIKGDPLKFKTFVAHHIIEIQSLVTPSQW